MTTPFTATYIDLVSDRPFTAAIEAFEAATGNLENGALRAAVLAADSNASFEAQVLTLESTSGFMRFLTIDHGAWMHKFEDASIRAKMYLIGNPLIARTMLRHDMAAGLNVPVRVQIFEDAAHKSHFAYHLPSSLMSVYGSPELLQACAALDAKLAHLAATTLGLPSSQ